ncbi:MAG: MoaD/ThiS family protein [bacterium]|nr:MoaD/ThiS family protein [bacterium]
MSKHGFDTLFPFVNAQVHLYGTLRRFSNQDTPGLWTGDIPEHATIRELMAEIGTTDREVSAASMNGRLCPLDTPIPPDAEIVLVTPIGGG